MTRSRSDSRRAGGAPALVTALLVVLTLAPVAQASNTRLPAPVEAQPNTTLQTPTTCEASCVAQQAIATALYEPIRIGNSRFRLGLESSKVTVGWTLAF